MERERGQKIGSAVQELGAGFKPNDCLLWRQAYSVSVKIISTKISIYRHKIFTASYFPSLEHTSNNIREILLPV